MSVGPVQMRPQVGVDVFRRIGLSRREVRLVVLHLIDGLTQGDLARRFRLPKSTLQGQLRIAIAKLDAAGLNVPRPHERCSRPGWSPPNRKCRTVDPHAMTRLTAERTGDGIVRATWIKGNDKAESPVTG